MIFFLNYESFVLYVTSTFNINLTTDTLFICYILANFYFVYIFFHIISFLYKFFNFAKSKILKITKE